MQQNSPNVMQDKARLVGKGDLVGIVQEIKIWPY